MTVLSAATAQEQQTHYHGPTTTPTVLDIERSHHSRHLPRIHHSAISAFLAVDLVAATCSSTVVSLTDQAPAPLAAVLVPCWILVILVYGGYDQRPAGRGTGQTRRILESAGALGAVVILSLPVFRWTESVGPILTAIVFTAIGTVVGRAIVTVRFQALRRGAGGDRAIVVGAPSGVLGLLECLRRDRLSDLAIVAACLVDGSREEPLPPLPFPVVENPDDLPAAAARLGCQTIIVLPTAGLSDPWLRRLSWKLADQGAELVVAPTITEVATDRVQVTEVGGALLMRVAAPQVEGPRRVLKEIVERSAAVVLLIAVLPLMAVVGALVRVTSPGPALFRQVRVGRGGQEFTCLKFRTMAKDADSRRHEVAHLNERAEGLLFKIRDDPRITPLGSFLRRSSLDELPQLVNVIRGEMALIGPRPPLPSEVAEYDQDLSRRLLVKPGMTGLWQVSGRSELPWPESIRLDMSYVDNWSPGLDARIILRTASAVFRGTGAY